MGMAAILFNGTELFEPFEKIVNIPLAEKNHGKSVENCSSSFREDNI